MRKPPKLSDWRYRLNTMELLRLAKGRRTYRELVKATGLPDTVLCRYIEGKVLPRLERAQELNRSLQPLMRLDLNIINRIGHDGEGHFDDTHVITDPLILELATQHAVNAFADMRVTKVLTPAVDGIPLATLIAHRLGVDIVTAKKEREVGVPDFLEAQYEPRGSGLVVCLYVPKALLRKGDDVLIVDDLIRSCEVHTALIALVEKARARVAGVFALIGVGDEWKTLRDRYRCLVEVIVQAGRREANLPDARSSTVPETTPSSPHQA